MGDEVSPNDVDLMDYDGDEVNEGVELTLYGSAKSAASDFLDDRWFNVAIAIITAYALFGDDFRLAFLPQSVDEGTKLSFFTVFALPNIYRTSLLQFLLLYPLFALSSLP